MNRNYSTNLLVVTIIGFVIMNYNLYGQRDDRRSQNLTDAERIQIMVTRLDDKLSLSSTQKEEISNIYTSHFEFMKEIRSSENEDREEKQEQIKLLKNELDENIMALLNEKQVEEYKKISNENKPGRKRERS